MTTNIYQLKRFVDQGLIVDQLPQRLADKIRIIITLSESDDSRHIPFTVTNKTAVQSDTEIIRDHYSDLISALPSDSPLREKYEWDKERREQEEAECRRAQEAEEERKEQERVEAEESLKESQRSLFDEADNHSQRISQWQAKVLAHGVFTSIKEFEEFKITVPFQPEKILGGIASINKYAVKFECNGIEFDASDLISKIIGEPIIYKWKVRKI